jgi:hypothetical protein
VVAGLLGHASARAVAWSFFRGRRGLGGLHSACLQGCWGGGSFVGSFGFGAGGVGTRAGVVGHFFFFFFFFFSFSLFFSFFPAWSW